jgi:hypothetical protein
MPWKVEKDASACSASKPWAVKNANTGAVGGRCHATRNSAVKQQRALYAALHRGEIKMSEHNFLVPVKQFAEDAASLDEDIVWVQAFPFDTWDHPIFGETTIDESVATKYIHNFNNGVRGQDIATNYDHGLDPAKGGKASGWIKEMAIRDGSLWFGVNFTETAKQEIKDGEWKYFSTEIEDEWTHPHTKEVYQDVVVGGGLTNRPWVKGMVPINFSEIMVEKGGKMPDDVKDESKEMEHSEPGTGSPPEPRKDEDGSDSKDITSGSRRNIPPAVTDPEDKVNELDSKLREALGLPEDADILKAVTEMKEEVEPLREAAKEFSEKRQFAEKYPEEYKRLQRLEKKDRENTAKLFSENYERFAKEDGDTIVRTTRGFSQKVVEKIEEVATKSFSERLTLNDLGEILDMVADNGIVEFSEKGSSRKPGDFVPESDNPRKAFAELVEKIKSDDKLDHAAAVAEAAKRDPELFDSYRVARPVE